MKQAWRYLAAGLAAYVLVLLATFPAQKTVRYIERQVDELVLRAVSGTVFSGRAEQLVYQGLDLGPVNWQFRPLTLLRGRLEYRLELAQESNAGQANVGLGLTGKIRVSGLALVLQPDHLVNHYSPVEIKTRGDLRLDIDALEIADRFPQQISGQADWADAAVVEPVNLALGQPTLLLENESGDLLGTINNAADFGINGELRIGPSGRYAFNVVIRPGPDVSAETLGMLRNTVQPQPDGSFLLQIDGQL